jgi:hypothetical protein
MPLDYRFEARFTDSVQIGPVDGGVRVDNYFDGHMTEGPLTGARVRGVDHIRIREDATAVLDVRETIETREGTIAADVRGYAVPEADAPHRLRVHGFALFQTALPDYAEYNSAVVEIGGTADIAAGTIDIRGRALHPGDDRRGAITPAAAVAAGRSRD